jgi:imidazole glycerol phosphate synthase glutamine amidotransferase subunit
MAGEVVIVRTGTANLASVVAALGRLGVESRLSESPGDVVRAERLVLPGVGTLAAAMERLYECDLVESIRERIASDRPTLAVCLGMQIMCEGSEESPEMRGLGIVPGRITRFPDGVRVPQLGWNRISSDDGCSYLADGYAYFANSYRLVDVPSGWKVARCDYAGEFVAAMERGNVLACQFHPELSGEFGLDIMKRWLDMSAR